LERRGQGTGSAGAGQTGNGEVALHGDGIDAGEVLVRAGTLTLKLTDSRKVTLRESCDPLSLDIALGGLGILSQEIREADSRQSL
jgi:hypothetical protein